MNKSIVVINTPDNCNMCPFKESPWSFCLGEYEKEKHCPLKPMPERINPLKVDSSNLLDLGYLHGRNDLINEMEGEVE